METIKSSQEISDLFSRGRRLNTPYLTFIGVPQKQHGLHGRVAFIAGTKLGNAVWRNTAKRRMRALCRELEGPWQSYDVIFILPLCKIVVNKVAIFFYRFPFFKI